MRYQIWWELKCLLSAWDLKRPYFSYTHSSAHCSKFKLHKVNFWKILDRRLKLGLILFLHALVRSGKGFSDSREIVTFLYSPLNSSVCLLNNWDLRSAKFNDGSQMSSDYNFMRKVCANIAYMSRSDINIESGNLYSSRPRRWKMTCYQQI